jgi:WD40 repeat protein
MKKLCLTLCLVLYINLVHAQKETGVWYFGYQAGLDFSTGSPVVLMNGKTNTREGTASACDGNGLLLFYTDGITVWDKNHNIMPNGDSLHGGHSSTQSALIIPRPRTSLFFIFTTQDDHSASQNLSYSIVDLNLNGGNGAVTTKNVFLMSQVAEKLSATADSDQSGVWVMTHGNDNNSFYAYLVTASGLNAVPVVSKIGQPFHPQGDFAGQLKFSPDGKKLAVAAWLSNFVELFDFDASIGQVTNNKLLNIPPANSGAYGIEFSPDGNYLYAANYFPGNIYQWDITSSSIAIVHASMQQIGGPSVQRGALQLGPDGKIYVANDNSQSLGVIHNPKLPGVQCNFIENSFSLSGKKSGLGLPNFIQSYFLSTGINQSDVKHDLGIYPNPVTEILYFENLTGVLLHSYHLFNITGQLVAQGTLLGNSISVAHLSKGIYGVRIVSEKKSLAAKFIKL